jgi:hypothetical protein
MKTILIVLSFLLIGQASYQQSSVTIKITGTRNKQLIVDNKTYTINNTATTSVSEITIPDLAAGQHTLELIRSSQYNTTNSTGKSFFVTRTGYDLELSIAANGSISTAETRTAKGINGGRGQLSTTAYSNLLAKVKAKRSATERSAFIENHFTTSNKKMTASQASELIKLVNSESLRLKLAKLSYSRITDTEKFSLVSNLLNSTSNKAALNDYIATVDNNPADAETALTTAEFNLIYQEVIAEPTAMERLYYLTNFFDRETNFYTAAQANQLLSLINNQADRNLLISKAYRGVTDKQNFSYNGTINTPMTDATFTSFYNSVKNAYSNTTRYNLLSNAFNSTTNYFTTYQARQLLSLVSSENDRLSFAKNVWNNITDQNNFSQLYNLFTSTSNRNDLMLYVNTMQNGNTGTVKIAMSETDYNTLYRNLQYSFGIGAKYSSLTDIFNTETNYFTVAQTKKLIQLVSSENNRLELAKLSYNNVTDPGNFPQLYDIFSSQASKNELINYVNSIASLN